jgi:hypothetical protein
MHVPQKRPATYYASKRDLVLGDKETYTLDNETYTLVAARGRTVRAVRMYGCVYVCMCVKKDLLS